MEKSLCETWYMVYVGEVNWNFTMAGIPLCRVDKSKVYRKKNKTTSWITLDLYNLEISIVVFHESLKLVILPVTGFRLKVFFFFPNHIVLKLKWDMSCNCVSPEPFFPSLTHHGSPKVYENTWLLWIEQSPCPVFILSKFWDKFLWVSLNH